MKKLLIASLLLTAGTAVLAQTPPTAPAPPMPMAHPMADKTTTRAEAVEMVREHFGKLDANKDGTITTTEVTEGHAAFAAKFKDFEGRGPHVMRFDGGHRDPKEAFDRLDANKDGSISRDEFTKGHEERIERRIVLREEMKERHKGGGDGKGKKHAMHWRGKSGMSDRLIVLADTDKDGKITMAEAEALALQHFDQMDANKDGQVTPEERRAGRPMIIKHVIEEKKTAS